MRRLFQYGQRDWCVLGLFVLGSALAGAFLRYEFVWDFCNYHYYNAWAFLNGRMGYDIAPASVNTYFNPFLDLIYYFLLEYMNDYPVLVSAVQGCYFGILLFVFWKINLFYFRQEEAYRRVKICFSMVIGTTGFATFSQLGTTTNEIQISILILAGFYLLVKELAVSKQKTAKFFLAGFLAGAALGLKLTAVIYCAALGILLLLMHKNLEKPQKQIFYFSLGGLCGFLLFNGYWMWFLWQHFDNPFFPFGNAFFQSPYFDTYNFSDHRYLPEGPAEFLFYPFVWAYHMSRVVAEVIFFDIRFAVAEILVLLCGAVWIKKRYKLMPQEKFLYGFMGIAYLVWLGFFGILRYLVPVEMLLGVFFVKVCSRVDFSKKMQQIIFIPPMILIFLTFVSVSKESEEWGKRMPDKPVVWAEDVPLEDGALVLLYKMPTAFLIPLWEKKGLHIRAMGMRFRHAFEMFGADFSDSGKYRTVKKQILENHHGQVALVLDDAIRLELLLPESELKYLPFLQCREFFSLYGEAESPLKFCTYRRE